MSKETKRLETRIEELEAQLARAHGKLANLAFYEKALEAENAGIAVFDADLRLGYCNQNYKRIFKQSAHLLTPGQPIEEIVRQIASSDLLPTTVDDSEAWIKERTEIACRMFDEPYFLQLKDGRWIRAINCKTDDGGFLAIRTDITELKQREAALQAKTEETRNILEAFFENSPVPMLVKDTDSRYRAVNSAFVDVHGISEKDILNKRMEEALPKTAAALGELADQSILDGDGPVYREHTIYRADGGERNVATTKFPVRDSAGAISAIGAISIDITKSMEMQATLSSKSRLLETTLRSIDQGFAVFDKDLRILACNQRFFDLHGYPGRMPADGLPLRDMLAHFAEAGDFGTKDPQGELERRFKMLASDTRPEREERIQADGAILDVRRTSLPDGGYVATFTDITELKRAEQKAENAHRFLEEILDTLIASVCLYDGDRRLVYCNQATRNLFGWQMDLHKPGIGFETQMRDALERGMVSGVGEDEQESWLRDKLREFDEKAINVVTERPGGKWIVTDYRPTSDGSTVAVHNDITDQKQAEIALRESEENFRSLVESTEIGISIGVRRRLLFVNDAFAKIFGYKDAQEALEVGVYDSFIAPNDLERLRAISDARSDNLPAPSAFEFEGLRKDGSTVWLQRTSRMVNWHGVRATMGTVIDLSQRHEAEEKLRAALDAAETANRTKSDFLAKMSHELRTPLNAIIGFSEVLSHETFGPLGHPRYSNYVDDIAISGRHLLEMINDILDMSKIESGRYEIDAVECDLAPIVSETVQVVRGQLEQQGIDFNLVIDPDTGPIYADQRAVRQILLNLLSNAIKFTPEGGRITLSTETKAGNVKISVVDTGIGIAKEDLQAVLQPFNQGSNPHSDVQPGTGLGLPIVKSLVELHGGHIDIASEPGQGTTVTIEMPNRAVSDAGIRAG